MSVRRYRNVNDRICMAIELLFHGQDVLVEPEKIGGIVFGFYLNQAIVVGVATLALGLALVVRINEAYGTIEEDEIFAEDEDD